MSSKHFLNTYISISIWRFISDCNPKWVSNSYIYFYYFSYYMRYVQYLDMSTQYRCPFFYNVTVEIIGRIRIYRERERERERDQKKNKKNKKKKRENMDMILTTYCLTS
jgi:hypothetical protein